LTTTPFSRWQARRLKRSEILARMLVERIQSMDLSDGDRLESEPSMIAEFQTGRGTLREAFRILELSGVLEVRTGPTGGPTVRRPDIANYGSMSSLFLSMRGVTARGVLEASLILEPPMAARAARYRDDGGLMLLRHALDAELGIGHRDAAGFIAAQMNFADTICDLARSPAIQLHLEGIHWIQANLWRDLVTVEEVQTKVIRSHTAILAAIEAGDPERAEAVTRKDAEASLQYTVNRFKGAIDQPIKWY
jgi:GntR family transcriptional regulator, transcriptional repressor for pyruvate dehydrogenase complex